MRTLIGILVFIGWSLISTYWYVCKIKGLCESNIEIRGSKDTGNLVFYTSGDEPLVNEETLKLIDSLKDELSVNPNSKLLVQGLFYSEEENETSFQNLGLARVNKVLGMYFNELDTSSFEISAVNFIPDTLGDQKLFRAIKFAVIQKEHRMDSVKLEMTFDKLSIYFPFNSDETKISDELRDSISHFAQYAKNKNGLILIQGNTDNIGSSTYNKNLGIQRAQWFMEMLISFGVDKSKMKIKSFGEDNPVSDNSTEFGRSKNRRVELIIEN